MKGRLSFSRCSCHLCMLVKVFIIMFIIIQVIDLQQWRWSSPVIIIIDVLPVFLVIQTLVWGRRREAFQPTVGYTAKSVIHGQPTIFTTLHGMQTRSYDENSVCPSVRLSVCQTRALWQNGRNICLDFYTIPKIIYPSFLRRRMFGGATPSTWNFGSTGPRWSEIADFESTIARSASVVIPSEKSSINIYRKSLRAFQ